VAKVGGGRRGDDLSSVAYWYQALPQLPFGLAPVSGRLSGRFPARPEPEPEPATEQEAGA
jgi:hypothetical protein